MVSENSIYSTRQYLNANQSSCDDVLSNRSLDDLADVFAAPTCAIINLSIKHGILPTQWKTARVVPIPEIIATFPLKSDLRSIQVTSGIAYVTESFTSKFLRAYFDKFKDNYQFGCTSTLICFSSHMTFLNILFIYSTNYQTTVISSILQSRAHFSSRFIGFIPEH